MGLFKKNPFGHLLFIKLWIIRVLGALSHSRFKGFNELKIEGSEVIKTYRKPMFFLFPITKPILQM